VNFLFGRWDPLNPRVFLAFLQVGFAVVFTLRPNIFVLQPAYQGFAMLDVRTWIWWAGLNALLLLFAPRGSVWQLTAQFGNIVFFIFVAGLFSLTSGLSTGGWTYSAAAGVGTVLFARTVAYRLLEMRWFQRWMDSPNRRKQALETPDDGRK
jgi:hypothetical protein